MIQRVAKNDDRDWACLFQLPPVPDNRRRRNHCNFEAVMHPRGSRVCAGLSQLLPDPVNGGCRAHHEILRVAEYQGSKDCCTHLRVGEKADDEAERCDPGRE